MDPKVGQLAGGGSSHASSEIMEVIPGGRGEASEISSGGAGIGSPSGGRGGVLGDGRGARHAPAITENTARTIQLQRLAKETILNDMTILLCDEISRQSGVNHRTIR